MDREPVLCNRDGISVLAPADGSNMRKLRFNGACAVESAVYCKGKQPADGLCAGGCGECPCEFDASHPPSSHYMKTMFEQMAPWCTSKNQTRVLSIGLGGGEMPQFLLEHCPNMHIETVELSEDVIMVARNYFGLGVAEEKYKGRLLVEEADALQAVTQKAANSYDLVLVDCFMSGGRVPESCRSHEFAQKVWTALRPSGAMMQNIWSMSPTHSEVQGQFSQTAETYKEVFHGAMEDVHVPMPPSVDFVHVLKSTKV